MKSLLALLALWASSLWAGIPVAVSVPPQAYLVDRIGGEAVEVTVMIPPGTSPETYAPSPKERLALEGARLYVKVGHPRFLFEKRHIDPFLKDHPGIHVVDMAEGAELLAEDPHLWVDPQIMAGAAQRIASALAELSPRHRRRFEANLQALLEDIRHLDETLKARLAPFRGRAFLVYHPAWGYFARRYGLRQMAIEQGGKPPGPRALIALIEKAKQEGIKVIFVQPGFDRQAAEAIARDIGARLVEVNPLAYDWLHTLETFGELLSEALGG